MILNYVIRNSDGDTYVDVLSDLELEENLEAGAWGRDIKILNYVPDSDTNYWGESIVIILGKVVDKTATQEEKEKEKQRLEEERVARIKEALAKLSPEDRKVLGV